jgi:predicted nucleotidyltransferase
MSEVPKSVLDEMVRVIVGSHARGNAGPDSDVDILVVDPKPYNENRSRISLFEKLLRRLLFFPFPLDLLLYSKDEVEDWKDSRLHVIGTAIREGKVLYERG